jgi:prepilin-type N-terminal cleavage/methylation domain-containing protein
MKKKFPVLSKGFTLIELLVVVAIIGLLSSIVLASLNSARTKGSDASIKSNVATIRSQAELIYSSSECYGDGTPVTDTTCAAFALAQCSNGTANSLFANSTVWAQITAAANAGAGIAATRCVATANGAAWAVAVQLKTGGTAGDGNPDSWCADSTGASKAYTWAGGETIANSINVSVCR